MPSWQIKIITAKACQTFSTDAASETEAIKLVRDNYDIPLDAQVKVTPNMVQPRGGRHPHWT